MAPPRTHHLPTLCLRQKKNGGPLCLGDFTPSFARKGKIRPLAILEKNKEFQKAFASLRHDKKVSEIVLETLEKFVCFMYAKKPIIFR